MRRTLLKGILLTWLTAALLWAVPVEVTTASGRNGVVVAGHPQAAEIGLAVLRAGGNAADAAVATSLALGVAEPYGSGLGGKLMLLYFDAKSGNTFALDAMDAAGGLDVTAYLRRPDADRSYGYGSVCVPGLPAGLWLLHQKWGTRAWAENVQPAVALAREGFRVLPKSRVLFEEQEKKLRRGDPEIARLYLPGGRLPELGTLLPNPDLARTLALFAEKGREGFYRGPVAEAIVRASAQGGGVISAEDLAKYEARISSPLRAEFREYQIVSSPPPTSGAVLFLPILKALEPERFEPPLRSAENLDRIGRVWRAVSQDVWRIVGDSPESEFLVQRLLAPESIERIRQQARPAPAALPKAAALEWRAEREWYESPMAATAHFIVVDRAGNIVCATQSQSLHFGAGVVPPGTGVVMNNSMSNFSFHEPGSVNYPGPGKRPRSTIAPTLVFRDGRPAFAIGIPGAARIPTALLQVLFDRMVFDRPLAEAIGDTRVHYSSPWRPNEVEAFEAEQSLPHEVGQGLQSRGWNVVLPEPAGTGRYFGGINAVEIARDGTYTGIADSRRTNAAAAY